MKSAALYVRVSTQEQRQHGISIESQLDALQGYCKEHNYKVYKIYNDAGISARKTYKRRPALMEMIHDCQNGDIDIILMTKLDRFFRSVPDYYAVMEQIGSVPWRTIWEDYETETANGVFKVNIMLAVSQSEADRTSERIKSVMDYKRSIGELVSGNMPLGYIIQDKRPVIDPETHDGVQAFWDTYLGTMSMNKAKESAKRYGVRIANSTGSFMLRNAMNYTGRIQGVECEPYITMDEAKKILATRKTKHRSTDYTFLFRGYLKCGECGGNMGSHRHRYKTGMQIYYNCTKHYNERDCSNSVNVSEKDIEKFLLQNYDRILHDARVETQVITSDDSYVQLREDISKLEQRSAKLIDLYMDGLIDKSEYIRRKEDIDNKLEKMHKKTDQVPVALPQELQSGWKELYSDLDNDHKRAFWMKTLSTVIVNPDRSMGIKFTTE